MEIKYFQTPIKRKANEFHSQVRTEQLSKMKATVRAVNEQSMRKQSQNDRFNKLCQKLAINCNNYEAFQEMKKMYKQEGFIIKQSNARKINLALKQFLKMSELKDLQDRKKVDNEMKNEVGCYLARQKKQSILRIFYQLLVLLTKNANRYPEYGCFDNVDFLKTLIHILKTTKHDNIRSQMLRLIIFISQNIKTKQYILSQNLIMIIAQEKFFNCGRLIEQLLADIFNIRGFKVSKENIDELMTLLNMHEQKIFTQFNQDSVHQIHFFIRCLTQQVSNQIKNYCKFVDLMFFLLRKSSKIDCTKGQNYALLYAKIVQLILHAIGQKYTMKQSHKNCLMQHLEKFWKINTETVRTYEQIINQIQSVQTQQQKQHCQTVISSFMTFFQHIKKKFPQSEKVKIYAQQLLYYFYEEFRIGSLKGKMTIGQFRFLIKYYCDFTDSDIKNLIDWYERTLQDKQCRIQCLKKLSMEARNLSIPLQDFAKLSDLYQEKRQNFSQKFDQLTDFILNHKPIPTLYDIQRKQHEINFEKQERQRKLMEENQKEDDANDKELKGSN